MVKKNLLFIRLILTFSEGDMERQNAVNYKARINLQESMKAEEQQAGTDQENESQGDFRNDKPLPQSRTTGCGPAPGFL